VLLHNKLFKKSLIKNKKKNIKHLPKKYRKIKKEFKNKNT
jgi:hypothetical protein